jgi:hypothetical protein
MYGSDINTLNVNLQMKMTDEYTTKGFSGPIWRKHGNQGNYWTFGHVFVASANDMFYRFQLEGLVGVVSVYLIGDWTMFRTVHVLMSSLVL